MPCMKTCCGADLAHFARVAAVYTTLLSLLMGAGAIWYFHEYHQIAKESKQKKPLELLFITEMKDFYLPMGISYVIGALILFAGSICLFVAVAQKSPGLTWPWYITFSLVIGNFLVRYCYHGLYLKMMPLEEPISGLVLLFVGILFYIVVCSYRQHLLDDNQPAFTQPGFTPQPPIVMQQQQYRPVPTTDEKYYPTPYPRQTNYPLQTVQSPYNSSASQTPATEPSYNSAGTKTSYNPLYERPNPSRTPPFPV